MWLLARQPAGLRAAARPLLRAAERHMSRVGKDPVKLPESVTASIAPYAPGELWPIKEPSAYRLYRMRKSRPDRESFQAFGTPHRVTITGPLGELRVPVHSFCKV